MKFFSPLLKVCYCGMQLNNFSAVVRLIDGWMMILYGHGVIVYGVMVDLARKILAELDHELWADLSLSKYRTLQSNIQ